MTAQKIQKLGELVREISERCYCASWLLGAEYFLPELCRRAIDTGKPQPWGHGVVGPDEARTLHAIAYELGHWVKLVGDAVEYKAFDPFPMPHVYISELDEQLDQTDK